MSAIAPHAQDLSSSVVRVCNGWIFRSPSEVETKSPNNFLLDCASSHFTLFYSFEQRSGPFRHSPPACAGSLASTPIMTTFSLPTSGSLTPRTLARTPSHETFTTDTAPNGNEKSASRFALPAKSSRSRAWYWRRQILLGVGVIFTIVLFAWRPTFIFGPRIRLQGFVSQTALNGIPGANVGGGNGHDPDQWLLDYSGDAHTVQKGGLLARTNKPKAALISLVRNQELEGIVQSMTQLEYHWNHKYQYPWIFFNDEPFTEEFKVR